jgi:hypothetical protein
VVDQAVLGFDSRRIFFAAVMQRHFDRHAGRGFDALEVNVQNLLFEGVHLQVAQQDLVNIASQFHLKDGGVESFFFDGMEQSVVIELDHRCSTRTTINNTGRAAGDAETAARTRALQCALKSGEFHTISPEEAGRDQLAS